MEEGGEIKKELIDDYIKRFFRDGWTDILHQRNIEHTTWFRTSKFEVDSEENMSDIKTEQCDLAADFSLIEYDYETLQIEYETLCDELNSKKLEQVIKQLQQENLELKLENALLDDACIQNNLT